jgi:hypothetical protein
MTGTILTLRAGSATRRVNLASYLDADAEEAAAAGANAWIKRLRHARVEGLPLRRRFSYRGDSLWWFAELYLHKQQTVLNIHRTIAALEALLVQEGPSTMSVTRGSALARRLTARFAAARGVRLGANRPGLPSVARLAAIDARGSWLHASALASRFRRTLPAAEHRPPAVLAFVHRAFWRSDDGGDGSAEQYIGPVLEALRAGLSNDGLQYVSVGPAANFGARRWWHPVLGHTVPGTPTVEAFASFGSLKLSRRLWHARHTIRRALWRSDDLHALAQIQGCDCWPVIRDELAGVALLQWPWSARAMDEAGAALDALRPSAVLTYAEAGGWGRAIMLECRRRGIPTAGLQHGFIYRHWLNYLHEPDEMRPDPENAGDAGFPHPSLTLLFDGYAARHLEARGRFPPSALRVTGSPRLDGLVGTVRSLSDADLTKARVQAGAAPGDALLVVTTKWKEAAEVLPPLLEEAGRLPGVHVAIKTHPAETPEAYAGVAQGLQHVTVLPAAYPLAPLLGACRLVVTVNSTVALDAAVLGVPALVLGLPNNLSPFVDAGIMVGQHDRAAEGVLRRILYDEGFRQRIHEARRTFLRAFEIESDGQAAARSAAAVLGLVGRPASDAER